MGDHTRPNQTDRWSTNGQPTVNLWSTNGLNRVN